MIEPLPTVLIAAGLVLAVLATGFVVLDRPIGRLLLVALGALEVGLLVQAVLGMVELASSDRSVNGLVFVGYLLGAALFVPLAAFWALGERSRAGTAVLVVLGLVVPVLVLRAQQVWDGAGA